jgi:hypothetical protein
MTPHSEFRSVWTRCDLKQNATISIDTNMFYLKSKWQRGSRPIIKSKDQRDACYPALLHDMTRPPATSRVAPVIQEEAEDRRKRVAAATSRG